MRSPEIQREFFSSSSCNFLFSILVGMRTITCIRLPVVARICNLLSLAAQLAEARYTCVNSVN